MYGVLGTLEGKESKRFRPFERVKRPKRQRCCQRCGIWCRNWCNKTNKTLLVLGAILGLPAFYMTLWLLLSPGISTLAAHFHPASCTVASSVVLEGVTNCTWSSCRQGCTVTELYLCWQVFVFVQVMYGNHSAHSAHLDHSHSPHSHNAPHSTHLDHSHSTHSDHSHSHSHSDQSDHSHSAHSTSGHMHTNMTHPRPPPAPLAPLTLTGNHSEEEVEEVEEEEEGNFTMPPDPFPTLPPDLTLQELQESPTEAETKGNEDELNFDHKNPLLPKGTRALTRLQANAEGCGYDPCEVWWRRFGRLGSTYACYLSADGSVAVPEVDLEEAATMVALGMLPLMLMAIAIVVLYVFYYPGKSKTRDKHLTKQQEVKWEQARHLILREVMKKDRKHLHFDPIFVKAALAKNQVAPSNLQVAKKGGKKM